MANLYEFLGLKDFAEANRISAAFNKKRQEVSGKESDTLVAVNNILGNSSMKSEYDSMLMNNEEETNEMLIEELIEHFYDSHSVEVRTFRPFQEEKYKFKELYKILLLQFKASMDEVKESYKNLTMKWHPDTFPEKEKKRATKRQAEITEAYTILGNEKSKKIYDEISLTFPERFEEFANQTELGRFFNEETVNYFLSIMKMRIPDRSDLFQKLKAKDWINPLEYLLTPDSEIDTGGFLFHEERQKKSESKRAMIMTNLTIIVRIDSAWSETRTISYNTTQTTRYTQTKHFIMPFTHIKKVTINRKGGFMLERDEFKRANFSVIPPVFIYTSRTFVRKLIFLCYLKGIPVQCSFNKEELKLEDKSAIKSLTIYGRDKAISGIVLTASSAFVFTAALIFRLMTHAASPAALYRAFWATEASWLSYAYGLVAAGIPMLALGAATSIWGMKQLKTCKSSIHDYVNNKNLFLYNPVIDNKV